MKPQNRNFFRRFRASLLPYNITIPRVDDVTQLWDHFHSGYSVVCVVHNYRLSVGNSSRAFLVPDLEKVYRSPSRNIERTHTIAYAISLLQEHGIPTLFTTEEWLKKGRSTLSRKRIYTSKLQPLSPSKILQMLSPHHPS